jgi:hypothetical protein
LPLSRSEPHDERKWLRTAQRLSGGPLRKRRTENLRTGSFRQAFHFKTRMHGVGNLVELQISRPQRSHCRA